MTRLFSIFFFFFFNDTATTEIYTLSLHDALPIFGTPGRGGDSAQLELDPLHLFVPVDVDNSDVVLGTALGREGEVLPIGRPVGLRIDEAIRLVVAADPGFEEPALHLARNTIGQVEVD